SSADVDGPCLASDAYRPNRSPRYMVAISNVPKLDCMSRLRNASRSAACGSASIVTPTWSPSSGPDPQLTLDSVCPASGAYTGVVDGSIGVVILIAVGIGLFLWWGSRLPPTR